MVTGAKLVHGDEVPLPCVVKVNLFQHSHAFQRCYLFPSAEN